MKKNKNSLISSIAIAVLTVGNIVALVMIAVPFQAVACTVFATLGVGVIYAEMKYHHTGWQLVWLNMAEHKKDQERLAELERKVSNEA